jgi:hypothetical protein
MFSDPQKAWNGIRTESWSVAGLYIRTIIPLALISPVAGYYGTTRFGWQIGATEPVRLTAESALQISIVYFGSILVAVFVIGLLIHWMSETYGSSKPLINCISLAAYSAVPLFFAGIFQVYPVLWVNFLFGLPALAYAVFLLYSGITIVMEIPVERGFMFASSVLAVCLVALVGLLASTVVLWSYGIGPAFTS